MKKGTTSIALALLLAACCVCGCGRNYDEAAPAAKSAASIDEATSAEAAASADALESTAGTQPSTAKSEKKEKTKKQTDTRPTSTPVQENIPNDTIKEENINPNIGWIQGNVASEINALSVQGISLSRSELNLTEGESAGLTISFNPANAAIKSCSVRTENSNATASISGKTVTVTAKKYGSCKVTVTSHNGKTAVCEVKVKRGEITDDTVLTHAELCNAQNAVRWSDEITAFCVGAGLKQNNQLSGESIVIRTASDKADSSFNSYSDKIVSAASAQLEAYTGGSYDEFEFNCAVEAQSGGEYNFIITLNRIKTE